MPPGYWLIKSEPFKYSWDDLVADGRTYWDGVRNYEARNNLQAMRVGDLALYYHSNEGKEVVGVARVVGESYPDPTSDDERWVVVDVEPVAPLARPVGLAEIKADPALADMSLIRRGRISVVPVERREFERVLRMGETKLGAGGTGKAPAKAAPAGRAAAKKKAAPRRKAAPRKGGAAKRAAKKKQAGAGRKRAR